MSYEVFYTLLTLIIILIFIGIIPYILSRRLIINAETLKNLYPAILIGFFSMLFLNTAFILDISGLKNIYKLFGVIAILFFLIAAIIIIRHTASEFFLLRELERVKGVFQTAIESSRLGFLMVDRDFNVVIANKRMGDFFALDPMEIVGKPMKKVLTERIKNLFENPSEIEKCECLCEDLEESKENTWKRISPSPLYIHCHSDPVYGEKGRLLGRITIYEDVTKESEREKEMRRLLKDVLRSKKEWQATFDSIFDFVYIHDNQHKILRINRPLKEKLALPYDSIIGEGCGIMEGIFFKKGEDCPHEDVVKTGLPVSREVKDAEGRVYFVTSYPFIEGGKITATINIARDVSVYMMLALAEEDRKRLEEIDRFRSQFVSLVSHELRTPLTSLMGFTELLLSMVFDRETEKRYIEIVYNESKRLGTLVDDILDLSRIEAGKLEMRREPFSAKELLEGVVDLYSVRSEGHPIHLEIPESLPEADGDMDKLRQVLNNLIDNAIKYSPEGGDIDIKASLFEGMIKIEVKDRGIGIPEGYLEKIWEPFGRVDMSATRTTKGTGLGLTIAKKIVELHGGRIGVESKVGKGSSFYFTIPVVDKGG